VEVPRGIARALAVALQARFERQVAQRPPLSFELRAAVGVAARRAGEPRHRIAELGLRAAEIQAQRGAGC